MAPKTTPKDIEEAAELLAKRSGLDVRVLCDAAHGRRTCVSISHTSAGEGTYHVFHCAGSRAGVLRQLNAASGALGVYKGKESDIGKQEAAA